MNNKLNEKIPIFILYGFIFILIGSLLIINFFVCGNNDFKTLCINSLSALIAGCGFAIVLYKLYLKQKDYLEPEINISKEDNCYFIKTRVHNKSGMKKEVEYALIFISHQNENPVTIMNSYLKEKKIDMNCKYTNHFLDLKDDLQEDLTLNTSIVIPLPFYYSENIRIGNESPAFTYTLANTSLENGIYTVRFFIFCKGKLHRSTADSLVIGNEDNRRKPNIPNGKPQTPGGNISEKSKSNN